MSLVRSAAAWAAFCARDKIFGRYRLRWDSPSPELNSSAEKALTLHREILRLAFSEAAAREVDCVVDVGSCDWYYARVLFEHFSEARVLGIEVDGSRRYLNLHRRKDLGVARARALSRSGRSVEYRHGDFRTLVQGDLGGARKILFTFFFPFVSDDPCLAWGLPPHAFANFDALVFHASRLARGREAWVLSAHQGAWESELAQKSLRASGVHAWQKTVLPKEEISAYWPGAYAVESLFARL